MIIIFLKITNDTTRNKIISIAEGTVFAQGIFAEYGVTYNDLVEDVKNGGFGSTSK